FAFLARRGCCPRGRAGPAVMDAAVAAGRPEPGPLRFGCLREGGPALDESGAGQFSLAPVVFAGRAAGASLAAAALVVGVVERACGAFAQEYGIGHGRLWLGGPGRAEATSGCSLRVGSGGVAGRGTPLRDRTGHPHR